MWWCHRWDSHAFQLCSESLWLDWHSIFGQDYEDRRVGFLLNCNHQLEVLILFQQNKKLWRRKKVSLYFYLFPFFFPPLFVYNGANKFVKKKFKYVIRFCGFGGYLRDSSQKKHNSNNWDVCATALQEMNVYSYHFCSSVNIQCFLATLVSLSYIKPANCPHLFWPTVFIQFDIPTRPFRALHHQAPPYLAELLQIYTPTCHLRSKGLFPLQSPKPGWRRAMAWLWNALSFYVLNVFVFLKILLKKGLFHLSSTFIYFVCFVHFLAFSCAVVKHYVIPIYDRCYINTFYIDCYWQQFILHLLLYHKLFEWHHSGVKKKQF